MINTRPVLDHHRVDAGPVSDVTVALRQVWLDKGAEGDPVPIGAIDVLDHPAILRHLVLIDVVPDAAKGRPLLMARFVGTAISDLTARNLQGRALDESVYGENFDSVTWTFYECIASKEPLLVNGVVDFTDEAWKTVETLFLPLFDDKGEVGQIISSIVLVDRRPDLDLERGDAILDWRRDLEPI